MLLILAGVVLIIAGGYMVWRGWHPFQAPPAPAAAEAPAPATPIPVVSAPPPSKAPPSVSPPDKAVARPAPPPRSIASLPSAGDPVREAETERLAADFQQQSEATDAAVRRQIEAMQRDSVRRQIGYLDDEAERLFSTLLRTERDADVYIHAVAFEAWERKVDLFLAQHYSPTARAHFGATSRRFTGGYPWDGQHTQPARDERARVMNLIREKRARLAEAINPPAE